MNFPQIQVNVSLAPSWPDPSIPRKIALSVAQEALALSAFLADRGENPASVSTGRVRPGILKQLTT